MEYAQVVTSIIQRCGLGPVNPDKWLFVEVADLEIWLKALYCSRLLLESMYMVVQ